MLIVLHFIVFFRLVFQVLLYIVTQRVTMLWPLFITDRQFIAFSDQQTCTTAGLQQRYAMRHFSSYRQIIFATFLILLFTFLNGSAWGKDPCLAPGWPSERSDLQPDPALVRGTLANGFRYVVMENNEPENRVAVLLYVHAGSLNETDNQRGVAHYIEHMEFNGSTHFPPGELVKFFQDIGMSFGGDTNAHTSYDETVYRIDLPQGTDDDLRKGFLVMADYARGALLTDKEVDRERGVILAEKRTRDSAEYRNMVAANKFKYQGTLLPAREVIGKDSVLLHADSKLLRSYYDAWYRPDNMLLVVVGDVTGDKTVSLIKEMFTPLKGKGGWPVCPDIGKIDSTGLNAFYHSEPDLGRTNVAIESIWNETSKNDSRQLQQQQLYRYASILILNNRIKKLQEEQGAVFTQAGYYSGSLLERIRYSSIMASTKADKWEETLGKLEYTLRQALIYGILPEEVERVKKDILSSLDAAVLTEKSRDSQQLAREIIHQFGDNRVFLSPVQERELYGPMLKEMRVEDINTVLHDGWPAVNRLVTVSGDVVINDSNPRQRILDTYTADAGRKVAPYQQKRTGNFPYLSTPANPKVKPQVEKFPAITAERLEFANNVAITLKATPFEKNTVRMIVDVGKGKLSEPAPGLALLAEEVVNDSGTGRLSSAVLADVLAGSTVTVHFGVGEESFRYSGKAVTGESKLLVQLVYHLLRDPGLRDQAWIRAMDRLKQMYDNLANDVQGAMRAEVERFLADGDPRVGLPPWDEVKKLKPAQLKDWLMPQIASGSLEVAIVGDFDMNTMKDLVTKYFGSLPKRAPDRAEYSTLHFPAGKRFSTTVKTEIAKSIVVAAWPTADFWDIHRTRRLYILADIFSDRLRQVIREKLGASYAPVVFSAPSRVYKGYGKLQAQVVVAPGREQEILGEIGKIAQALHDGGISETELERAKRPVMTELKESVKSNEYWLNSVLAGSKRHPQQLEWPLSILQDFGEITVDQIGMQADRYLVPGKMATAVIRPVPENQKNSGVSQ